MNNFLSLVKTMYKSGAGIGVFGDKDGVYKKIIISVLLCVALLPTIYFIFSGTDAMYKLYAPINMEDIIIIMGLCGLSLMVLFFGIFYVLGLLYFSKDIENYLYLPIKPWKILSGKLLVVLFYEYITLSIMYFPVMIAYGLNATWGIGSFLLALVIFIILPIIPLVIASIIVMVLMRFSNIAKKKDSIKFIVSIVLLIIILASNFAFDYFFSGKAQEILIAITSNKESIVRLAELIFPPIAFAAKAILGKGIGLKLFNLLSYIVLSVTAYIIFVFLGQRIYLKGVVGLSETGAKRKVLSDGKFKTISRRKNMIITYALKEIKILFRVPAYLFNCIVSEVVMIALIIVPMYVKNVKVSGLDQVISMVKSTNSDITILVIFCLGVALSAINAIAITAISREGEQFYVMKYLPISYIDQIKAKILAATIIGECFNIILIAALAFILEFSIKLIIVGVLVSTLGAVFTSFIGVIIDMHLPKLTWDSEQKLIKQNLNILINLGVSLGSSIGIAYLIFNWGGVFIPIPILLTLSMVGVIAMLHRYIKVNIEGIINNI